MRETIAENGGALRQYSVLDALKLFFALCVVAIHTYATEGLPESVAFGIQQSIFRLAVPFFFVTSGFFLGRKLSDGEAQVFPVLKRYVRRLLPPLAIVGISNGALELLLQYLRKGSVTRDMISSFVRHLFFYPYGAMWYVLACVVGALLLYPFLKRKTLKRALLIGALLYVWALLCNNYYFAAERLGIDGWVRRYMDLFISGRNGVFVGFFCLALGIRTYEWHRSARGSFPTEWGLAICCALYLAEIYLLKDRSYLDDRALYVMQIPLVPLLVLCAAKPRFSAAQAAVRMRRASTWLYFSHRLVYVLGRILRQLAFRRDWRGVESFFTVSAVCLATFAAWEVIRRRRRRQHYVSSDG